MGGKVKAELEKRRSKVNTRNGPDVERYTHDEKIKLIDLSPFLSSLTPDSASPEHLKLLTHALFCWV